MNIKNIILDIGGVLAHPKSGHWFITNNFYNIIDKEFLDAEKFKESLNSNFKFLNQNPKNEKEEQKMFSDYYFKVLSDINYPKLNKKIVDKIADDCVYNDEKFVFYDDVEENLKRLSKKYNLYIISNGWPSTLRILNIFKIDKYFKGIMMSSMYTSTKEENLFNIFLEKYKLNPKECVFIDDRSDLLDKAAKHGFNVLLMNRKNSEKNNKFKTIYSLKEIN